LLDLPILRIKKTLLELTFEALIKILWNLFCIQHNSYVHLCAKFQLQDQENEIAIAYKQLIKVQKSSQSH